VKDEASCSEIGAINSMTIILSPSYSMLIKYCICIIFVALSALVTQGPEAAWAMGIICAIASVVFIRMNTWTIHISPEGIRCARGMSRGLWTRLEPKVISWSDGPSYEVTPEKDWQWVGDLPLLTIFLNWMWPTRHFTLCTRSGSVFTVDASSRGAAVLQASLDKRGN